MIYVKKKFGIFVNNVKISEFYKRFSDKVLVLSNVLSCELLSDNKNKKLVNRIIYSIVVTLMISVIGVFFIVRAQYLSEYESDRTYSKSDDKIVSGNDLPAELKTESFIDDTLAVVYDYDIQHIVDEFELYIDKRIRQTKTVGAGVAIVHKGKVVLMKPYGVTEVGSSDSVTLNTVFRLASVSKGFAGILASVLHDEGSLMLDEKIKDYIPQFTLKDTFNTNNLTLRHTLCHSTGLVPHSYDDLIELGKPLNEIYEEFSIVNLSGPPGRYYSYQNVIFSAIDTILRVKEGKTYAEVLEEKIFKPLGMNTASATYDDFQNSESSALPHSRYGHRYRKMRNNDKYYNVAPAAGVNASIKDMAKWLIALEGYRPDVLSPCAIELASTKEIRTHLRWQYLSKWRGVRKKYYGLGWRVVEYRGRDVMYHGGFVNGYRAEIAVCPESEIGIVFLENSPNGLAAESLPRFLSKFFNEMDSQDRLLAIK